MLMRLLNMGLRGSTLIAKFILIFFLARLLEPQAVGLYGLLIATIAYCLFLVGFDFYTYSTRDLLKHDKEIWGQLFKSQGAFFGLTYLIVLPLTLFLFVFDLLPWAVVLWFLVLLVLEHISQELNRLLVVLSAQLIASLVLFLRSGAWCLLAIGLMFWKPEYQHLNTVLAFWVGGNLLAIALGVWHCSKLRVGGWHLAIDWDWIRKGLKVAIPLLIGTLALRGIYTLDRYWFEALVSREVLGAYVLFIGMCNALMAFLDAGVFMYSYPALIRKYNASDQAGFKLEMKRLWWLTVALSAIFVGVSVLALPWILRWLNHPVYVENQALFWWLLASTVMYALGAVPQYGLYAQNKDKPIVGSHVMALVLFIPLVWLLARNDPYLAIVQGLLIVFTLALIVKFYVFFREGEMAIAHEKSFQ